MTAAPRPALSTDHQTRVHGVTPRAQMSRSNGFDFGGGPGGVDRAVFVAWFRPVFARWLQAHFRNPEAVAAAYGVRYQTALNWWQGANTISGDLAAVTFMSFPAAVSWFLSEWEGR